MIAKSYIFSTLSQLDKLFIETTSQKKAIYFSKLALIELCGWIEETMDDIVQKHANRNLRTKDNKDYCRESIVSPNYGFQYKRNIRPMLISLIGLIEVEKIEVELEKTGKITLLKGYLGTLNAHRNEAAHTHLKGVTRNYNAPSRTIGDYRRICSVLELIDSKLREY